jgi:catechol 2,3-dioxygenase-like lactoylglutathione lyase family enzyme
MECCIAAPTRLSASPRLLKLGQTASGHIGWNRLRTRFAMTEVKLRERRDIRSSDAVRFYGVHHLALNTDDMKMTVDFYAGVLGMPLVHAMKVPPGLGTGPGNRGNPPFEEIRHYFFDMGRDGLLAFFEMPKGKKQAGDRNALGAMQHVSFAVSPESQKRICTRLKAANVPFDGPLEILPGIFSIYVFDPNDIRLEFSCQPSNGEGEPLIVPQVTQSKDEALRELKTLTNDKAWLDNATAELRE